MKRMICLICAVVMTMSLLAGCGGSVTIDVNKAADALKADLTYVGSLQEIPEKQLETIYDGLDAANVVACKVYMDAYTAEEIAVFEMTDATAATALKEVFEGRVDTQYDLFSSYAPEGAARIEKAAIKQNGKYVILCISDDTAQVSAAVDAQFK